MKRKTASTLIAALLAALATYGFVLMEKTGNLTVSYVFLLLGLVVATAGIWVADMRRIPASYAGIRICFGYLPATLVLSIIIYALGAHAPSVKVHVLLQLVVLAVFLVPAISLLVGQTYIEALDQNAAQAKGQVSDWKLEVDALARQVKDEPSKKALESLSQVIRFSDPVSNQEVKGDDEKIADAIASLGASGDKVRACADIEEMLQVRNQRLKSAK